MSDEFDWDFSDPDDAKAEIRAAVRYLLNGAAGSDRGDIVGEIIAIVHQVARGLAETPWTMTCLVASPAMTLGRPQVSPGSRAPRVAGRSVPRAWLASAT